MTSPASNGYHSNRSKAKRRESNRSKIGDRPSSVRHDDAELVRRCLGREQGAWDALVERYADLIHAIARRSGLDGASAEDVVQDVFLRLFRNLRRLRDGERVRGWIAMTARRESWRVARRIRTVRERDEQASENTLRRPSPLPEDLLVQEERHHLVHRAMRALASKCRRILEALFLRESQDYRALSVELGMPVGSIGPTRKRCLEKMVGELAALNFPFDEPASRLDPASRLTVSKQDVQDRKSGRNVSGGRGDASSTMKSVRSTR